MVLSGLLEAQRPGKDVWNSARARPGALCDDLWDMNDDANVACRQAGFSGFSELVAACSLALG